MSDRRYIYSRARERLAELTRALRYMRVPRGVRGIIARKSLCAFRDHDLERARRDHIELQRMRPDTLQRAQLTRWVSLSVERDEGVYEEIQNELPTLAGFRSTVFILPHCMHAERWRWTRAYRRAQF